MIRLISSHSKQYATFFIDGAYYEYFIHDGLTHRDIVKKAKRTPGKALALAKKFCAEWRSRDGEWIENKQGA